MLKKLAAFVGLIALAICSTAGSLNIRNLAGNQRADLITGRTDQSSTRYPWTDAEYLERGRYQPNGGLTIILANSDSTYYANALAQVDSIYYGRGVYADTPAIIGQRIRLTVCVDPESTRSTRVASGTRGYLTIAEVQALAARSPDVEVAVTGSENCRLGWRGIQSAYNANGLRVTAGGVTGMKLSYVQAVFDMWQDSTASWGILPFRSVRWPDDRYTPGIDKYAKQYGIYQGVSKAFNLNSQTASWDVLEQVGQDSPNYAPFASALFQGGGINKWVGIHMIGEQINPYNKGCRFWSTGRTAPAGNDTANGGTTTVDSLTAWIDASIQGNNIGFFIVDGQVGASTGFYDIKKAHFGSLCEHVAHRQAEDLLDTYTLEQAVARTRGIRDGDLINSHGFMVLDSTTASTYRYGAIKSKLLRIQGITSGGAGKNSSPIGFPMPTDWFVNGSADSFARIGDEATTRPTVMNLSGRDSIANLYSSADSVSYGFASSTGNVICQLFQSTSQGRPLSFFVPTMGCDAKEIEVRLQWILGGTNVTISGDSVVMTGGFGQFSEKWDDHLMEGQSAYQLGAALFRAGQKPDTTTFLPDSLLLKERMLAQFTLSMLAMADTSRTTTSVGRWIGSATPADTSAKTFAGTPNVSRPVTMIFRPSGAGTIGTTVGLTMLVTDGIGKTDTLAVGSTYTPGTAIAFGPNGAFGSLGVTVAFSAGAGAGLAVEAAERFIVRFGGTPFDLDGADFTDNAGQSGWFRELLALKSMGGGSLTPVRIGFATSQADWAYRYSIGNPRNIKTVAVSNHTDPYIADLQSIRQLTDPNGGSIKGRIYNSVFKIPINENTDYVYGYVSPQLFGGTTTNTAIIYYLDISARPCS